MAHLLSIPENVIVQHLLPCLDHNDLLRLRRVSKQIKALSDAYLWTPLPGHQGKWELEIDSNNEDQTLAAFLQKGLPPPSRLYIANEAEEGPSEQSSFFKDEHLEEFMKRYSKYVTKLKLDKLFFPFTSEIHFYQSLVNLKKLDCEEMVTVGGATQFEKKTRRAEGSFLIRPTFKNLKVFKLSRTDCIGSMWNLINGLSNNLEKLLHPFPRKYENFRFLNKTSIAPIQELIERRGVMRNQDKLLYDWRHLLRTEPLELLRVFASCRDNGVIIKKLDASYLDCLLCDEKGRIDRRLVRGRAMAGSSINQTNRFVGSVIHSLIGVNDTVFLLDLPVLEDILIHSEDSFSPRPADGYPEWPNLRRMDVNVSRFTRNYLHFLEGGLKLPKLEELTLVYCESWKKIHLPIPRNLGVSCGNVKKLDISFCPGNNGFFLRLWEELPLLEHVTLSDCWNLTNTCFEGNGIGESRPAFLNLTKLKHLTILNLDTMTRITDAAFKNIFRHLKLISFELSSARAIQSITINGLRVLLTGPFAETIEKLDLAQLQLRNVSEEQLKQVVSCFRSSKML